jgi:hypothetical protein
VRCGAPRPAVRERARVPPPAGGERSPQEGKALAERETEAAIMHEEALLRDSPLLCCAVERRAVEG